MKILKEIVICVPIFLAILYTWYVGYVGVARLERKNLGLELRVCRLESKVVHLMTLDEVVKGMVPRLEWAEERISTFHYRMDVLDSRATEVEKKIFPEKFKKPEYPNWEDGD